MRRVLFFLCVLALMDLSFGYPYIGNSTSQKCLQMTQKKEKQVKEIVDKVRHFIFKLGEQYKGLDLTMLHIEVDEQRKGQPQNDKTIFKVTVNNCIRKDGKQPEEYDYDEKEDPREPTIINQYTINNQQESYSYNSNSENTIINEDTEITNTYYNNLQTTEISNEQNKTNQDNYQTKQLTKDTDKQQNNKQTEQYQNDQDQSAKNLEEKKKSEISDAKKRIDQQQKNKGKTTNQTSEQKNKDKTTKEQKTNKDEAENNVVTVFQWNLDDNGEELLDLLERNGIKNSPFIVYEQPKGFMIPKRVVKVPKNQTAEAKTGVKEAVEKYNGDPTMYNMYLSITGDEVLDMMKEGDNPVMVFIQEDPEAKRLVVFKNNKPGKV